MDLISREKLAHDMYEACFEEDYYSKKGMQKWDNGNWIRYKVFEEILRKQPSAEEAGKWINSYDLRGYHYKICSECNTYIEATFFANDYSVNFCPNCGARMVQE